MDKSSVIHFLRIQEIQLENQLKALRQTMALIEGSSVVPDYSGTASVDPAAVGEASAPKEEEEKPASKVQKGALVGKKTLNGRKVRPVKVPKAYDKKMSFTKKLAFLLSTEGPQTSQNLIKLVEAREPGEDKTKIARSVTITASSMYRKGLVNARREGRAYVYSI